ncbi:uncharacterized protein LOC117604930 [Osmia lignaria lignaria]|uniref:uncharacterized protein LOC117604930 n=1 Tax=Osmia lignaria lignaria TaxID=1437193 RepID=UPI0014781F4D|nr:uncharacterized protein LOC117604930 [Osmia lignaria]
MPPVRIVRFLLRSWWNARNERNQRCPLPSFYVTVKSSDFTLPPRRLFTGWFWPPRFVLYKHTSLAVQSQKRIDNRDTVIVLGISFFFSLFLFLINLVISIAPRARSNGQVSKGRSLRVNQPTKMRSQTIALIVFGILAVALSSPVPGYHGSYHHVKVHVPYHVHTVHHHHVKKVPVHVVEKVPVPVPIPIHHVKKVAVPVPVHHVEKVHVPVPIVEKVHVPVPVHEEKQWW